MEKKTISVLDKRSGNNGKSIDATLHVLTIEEVKSLSGHATILSKYYSRERLTALLTVKINGKPKTWKTRPDDVTVPVKYGLYEYARIEYKDGVMVDDNLYFVEVIE